MKKVLYILFVLVFAGSVFAEDLVPPPWRGAPGTTVQGWEFLTPDPLPFPDWGENPFGFQAAEVIPFGPWEREWDGRIGVWPLSGEIVVPIWNYDRLWPEKRIWVQVTWAPMDGGAIIPPIVEASSVLSPPAEGLIVDEFPVGPGMWMYSAFEVVLQPNPDMEWVHIFGDVYVDELVIDTWCIPEPASMVLLGFGGILLRRRR